MTEWLTRIIGWSDGHRELAGCRADPVAGGEIGGEFIMTAAEVLHEGVPGGQDPRGPVAFQAAHRPQPGLQPSVIGLDRIVRVALDGVQSGGDQPVQDPRIGRARSVVTSAGTVPARSARVKNRRAAARSRRADSSTSMTWPCWSTAR
jgi:hypothetical protein